MLVAATERRRRRLEPAEWQALETNEPFWQLVENGYVEIAQRAAGAHEIVGRNFVGRAYALDVELVVAEKVPGALSALLAYAIGSALRLEPLQSPQADFDALSMRLMHEFVDNVRDYAANRRISGYEYSAMVSPALGGSLSINRTVVLHARGLRHLFAYDAGRVVRDSVLDHVILASLDIIDRSGTALGLPADLLYDARWLAGALEEARRTGYQATTTDDLLVAADSIAADSDEHSANRDLARLATVVMLNQGFDWSGPSQQMVPRAWFVDLEKLFEQAVQRCLEVKMGPLLVDRGQALPRRLFSGGSDHSRVHPDLVIHTDTHVLAVGDVKYKSPKEVISESPVAAPPKRGSRADIYQVLAHASSLGSRAAFLVYPTEALPRVERLGYSATGIQMWVAEVRPHALEQDLAAFAAELSPVTASHAA